MRPDAVTAPPARSLPVGPTRIALTETLDRMLAGDPMHESGLDAVTLALSPTLDAVLTVLKAGVRLPERDAGAPLTVIVLNGRIALTTTGGRIEAGPHDLVTLPAGVAHRVQAIQPSAFLTLHHLLAPRGGPGEP